MISRILITYLWSYQCSYPEFTEAWRNNAKQKFKQKPQNPKRSRKWEIPGGESSQQWFSRNLPLLTMGQDTHTSPGQTVGLRKDLLDLLPHAGIHSQDPLLCQISCLWHDTVPQPPHLMVLRVVDPHSHILKKSFLTCPSHYQISKIKRSQTCELSKLWVIAKPHQTTWNSQKNLTEQELEVQCLSKDGNVITTQTLFQILN